MYKRWLAGALIGVWVLCAPGCANAQPRSRSAVALDTTVTVTLYDPSADEAVLEGCMERIRDYEALFSRTLPDSDIGRINAAGGDWVTVSQETRDMLEQALTVCRQSEGAFDITIAPVTVEWDFTASPPQLPDQAALAGAVALVDYTQVEIEGDRVRLAHPQAALDPGGVAKGYIADRLGDYLREQGVDGAVVDLGGNILTVGSKQGKAFTVGVRDPLDETALAATLRVTDTAVVTSGSYERGFALDGVRYHHILDPATGYPVQNGLVSVTIKSEQAMLGDMLSTACFVMGEERGLAFIGQMEGVEALFIREDGTQIASAGFFEE